MPNIYKYIDYRAFLRDYYKEKKSQKKTFSYQNFAKKAGIASSGFILHVIKGERNLTKTVMLKIAHAIGLPANQIEYFDYLVSFEQAKTQSEREFYYIKIAACRHTIKIKDLDNSQYAYFSQWYYAVVREIMSILGKRVSPADISRLLIPSVSTLEIRQAIKTMVELEIITENENGEVFLSDPFIGGATSQLRKTAVVRFQKEMANNAHQVWDNFKDNEFAMSTVTFSISNEVYPQCINEIKEFKKRLLTLIQNDSKPASKVYNINMHLFPVSKSIIKEH